MAQGKAVYDEKTIQSLDALAHIRLRTGMYIGRIGDGSNPQDGIYVLLKEIVDNSVDEFIMGAGKSIDITLADGAVTVRDQGRGIPLGKVVACVSQINTGGKYNDDVFQFSVGLNGVGTKAVNALSHNFLVISYRDGAYKRASFERGKLVEERAGKDAKAANGCFVRFIPDPEIFKKVGWNHTFIEHRLQFYAYLNRGLTLTFNGKAFCSALGLADLLADQTVAEERAYPICHCTDERIEFALTHTQTYGETYYSFVNGQHTNDGGTHQSAFREGILKAINAFANRTFAGEDVREGIVGAIAVKVQDPVFESQTKNKLGTTEIRSWVVQVVRDQLVRWLHQNAGSAKIIIEKIRASERLRRELMSVKKEARERAKKTAVRVPKLIDCKVHLGDERDKRRLLTTVFLTEGDSAGGAMVQSRDVYTQAIFTLKGKPLNCFGQSRDTVYKNEELYNIMRALGLEDGLENLRYQRVVIATDADVDGMHIRNLLLCYFLRFFEPLVSGGHVFILETPLFRVRNKKTTRYCYSEAQRDVAMKALPGHEVTRFKGLGEISPQEFGQFIGSDIRLFPVNFSGAQQISESLTFFMGKNTPERRQFIIDNLIADIEV